MNSVTVSVIEKEPLPTWANHTFKGWYYDSAYNSKVSFPLSVTRAMTLYAKWEEQITEITYTVSDGEITGIASAPEGELELVIPSEINGETITGLAFGAFANNKNIVKVTLPSTIKTIAGQSFRYCTALAEVNLPDTVVDIRPGAFEKCYALTSIDLPESLDNIAQNAFMESGLTSIKFPNTLKSVGAYAFGDCTALAEADLGSVETLDRGAFSGCTSLTSVVVPETVKTTDHHIFTDCTQLADIKILADNAYVYSSMVYGTAYYNNPENWTDGVLYIGKYLITAKLGEETDYNPSLVTVKEGTTVISAFAFDDCYKDNITSINLPSTLLTIGESAFRDLAKLADINIPDSVTRIVAAILDGTAIYNTDNSYWSDNGLYVGNYLIAAKRVAMSEFTVKDGTKLIADGQLFGGYSSSVTSVNLPDSLEIIGTENFSDTSITEIVFPANIRIISDEAFYFCSSLTSVDTSACARLKSIGYSAFAVCGITSFYIPSSVTAVGEVVFNGNKNITVNCAAPSKPDGWHTDWSRNYSGTTTVNWGVQI